MQAIIIIFLITLTVILFRTFRGKSDAIVTITTETGQVKFTVEVADTFGKRALGLMYRKELPSSSGMLFVYDSEGYYSFWMKNTYIPLDIIFISADGVVVDLHANAEPYSTSPIVSKVAFKYALEINAGLAQKYSIKIGNKVDIKFLK